MKKKDAEKKNSKSKMSKLKYFNLKAKQYLMKLPVKRAKLLIKARTHMLDVKMNFGGRKMIKNKCPLGCSIEDSQSHLFSCKIILQKYPEVKNANYEDLFSDNIEKIKIIIEILEKILTYRDEVM